MSATNRVYERKLFHSCRILFGADVDIGWDFLFYLQPSGIKSAFRKRAFLTHPDRAVQRGDAAASDRTRVFIEARHAYEYLLDFVHRKHTFRPPGNRTSGRKSARTKARPGGSRKPGRRRRPEYFFRGKLPARTLLLGEFLFYTGLISWEAVIRAIVWQRRQRPRLGDMASERGWVDPDQARAVALEKGLGVPIGKALVDCGLLSRGQVQLLLWGQRRLQQSLGEYFVAHGHLSRERLEALLETFDRHNSGYPSKG